MNMCQSITMMEVNISNSEGTGCVLCTCGGIIMFSPQEVKIMSKKIVECEICKTKILLVGKELDIEHSPS